MSRQNNDQAFTPSYRRTVVNCAPGIIALLLLMAALSGEASAAQPKIDIPHVSSDKSVRLDYSIVYVRAPRYGDEKAARFAEVMNPMAIDPGADLMLLKPDGSEEVLVEGGNGAVADPYVSFDGEWVYYALLHDQTDVPAWGFPRGGSDIYKIHLPTREIVRLTNQERTPNTGILTEEAAAKLPVFNLGPCPAPGGKVVFTSTRNFYDPPKGYTQGNFQLFVMDDPIGPPLAKSGKGDVSRNVEMIGHLNIGSALHPTILRDGRVMFSSYESQALRDLRNWSLWFIYPDGTGWGPLVSSFQGADAYHFQTQLSDGSIVFEAYYNANNFGFGTLYSMPTGPDKGYAAFGPANRQDDRNPPLDNARKPRFSFTPYGLKSLTRYVSSFDDPAPLVDTNDPASARVGKYTHPSGAPDNHLLTVWSPGGVNSNGSFRKDWYPRIDSGIYLIRDGAPIDKPGQMLLVKNDPKYNEQWPRAVVPYRRIYGVVEPAYKAPPVNDGNAHLALPAGSPYGLVGTSSMYKRESFPNGTVPEGSVTAVGANQNKLRGLRQFNANWPFHDDWNLQGSECGLYENERIHAIRIVAQEPTTRGKRMFWNWGSERYRILGEIPVRKFSSQPSALGHQSGDPDDSRKRIADNSQRDDPDGHPDTSFLARIPADTAFTFQLLDKDGLMLTMAQTWHQVRPGEIRHDCGGCHAHSQKPTLFAETAAARPDYKVFDLTTKTPLLTSKQHDESKQQWDTEDTSGLRYAERGGLNVEFYRHVVPIFQKSCAACHGKSLEKPAARLVLDDLELVATPNVGGGMFTGTPTGKVPATYAMLAMGATDRYGHLHVNGGWITPQVSHYVRTYAAMRSLLAWKVLGRRTDGWSNDDSPTTTTPGDATTLQLAGVPVDGDKQATIYADVDFDGSVMPPPAAVKAGKVEPLSDEDRRTIFRWIDLGCPVDLDFDPKNPEASGPGSGWMDDETRPTITLTQPATGRNENLSQILLGMCDAYTGLDMDSFTVTADFEVDGIAAGKNLATRFAPTAEGVWQLALEKPVTAIERGTLTVSVRDRQGNVTRLTRTFNVGKAGK